MKRKRTGFTVVEILTVVTIIAILLGVLIPALSMVRNFAKETRQKAQIASIELAILAFRGDYGDYPPSDWPDPGSFRTDYCGAQKLAEALLGWDLLGFHPDSHWQADGKNDAPYWADGVAYPNQDMYPFYDTDSPVDMDKRVGPYLELANANAFRLGPFTDPVTSVTYPGLYNDPTPLAAARFVLCDTFNIKTMTMTGPDGEAVTRKAGTPILYYRANPANREEVGIGNWDQQVYDKGDNVPLVEFLPSLKDGLTPHPLGDPANGFEVWCNTITDPQIWASTGKRWPYNPDSYILISAGLDGLYGTEDDITNFGN
mgnify:CR=1 FL=1